VRTNCFIAAEALTNVAKYADAASARITATRAADCLVLEVEDDGAGGPGMAIPHRRRFDS
jgi:signal transduction histidine kinase